MEIKKWLNEEQILSQEVTKKEDIGPILSTVKKTLLSKGFKEEVAAFVVGSFLKQLNSTGWFEKILENNASTKDINISVDGSNVVFTVISDASPRDMKTITIPTVSSPQKAEEPAAFKKTTIANADKGVYGKTTTALGAHKKI